MAKDTLTVTDNRTGKTYELPIEYGTDPKKSAHIRAKALREIKASDDDFGLLSYDPAFFNTASCKSASSWVDGEAGVLLYRGYPIEQLAESSNYLEVAYLLIYGELPTKEEYEEWQHNITYHTIVHESIKKFMDGFNHDAHPMGMLVGTLGALATFYPDARNINDDECRDKQMQRLIAKVPTISAFAYRHARGMPYVYPDNELSYVGNFTNMMWKTTELKYEPDKVLEKALDVLFILHADHDQNCSASTMRTIGSSHADPYSALAGATAALWGPLHGGANEMVLRMLGEIGDKKNIPSYVERAKSGEVRLMGFGHRVYKNYDPRARIIKKIAEQVFEVTGRNPMLDIALELERIALEDDYFVSRKLYPNVDFYSGIIYQAMGIPVEMFPLLFAIPRTSGWLAQWREQLTDPDQKIWRPREIWVGEKDRDYVPMGKRQ
jgi:citrate synthase